ncbi:MAG TPA: HAMP domain-containing sensor histidine kinase [Clostridia bacterium]|nr:HAMP domain-containing sensor histidine kinase [Clostridia bacterium]
MKVTLRTKLTLSHVTTALICVALISFFSNILLERYFQDYVKSNQEKKNKEVVSLFSYNYQRNEQWDAKSVQDIGVYALERGMIVEVKDLSGSTIWDAMSYNNGWCEEMLTHMTQNMYSRYPNWKGELIETSYPVFYKGDQVGSIDIGHYGPFYFDDNDLAFITALNRIFIGVGIFSLLLAFLFGSIISKRITTPITRVINSAQMIAKGYFGDRSDEQSNTKEISQLTDTINDLAASLETQEKLRKRLTGDVAHELRTPVATLQSHLEAMLDGIWEPSSDRLTSCHEETIRINKLIGDLEKLARYESDNMILNKEEFCLCELLKRLMHNFENDFMQRNIKIEMQCEHKKLYADRDKMSQVLVNLISNALKYSGNDSHVTIAVDEDGANTIITVSDTGIGISEDDLPYVFERFYRADKSRNRMTGGSGIGLTIAKAIVEAHKGDISVKSKLGEGTVFTVVIPKQAG